MIERYLRYPGRAALLLGALAGLTYAAMLFGTLVRLEALSGQIPFDMRPGGYNRAEAIEILTGLEAYGRGYYLTRQLPLDTLYPALLALCLIALVLWLRPRLPRTRLTGLAILSALTTAGFDYLENLGIAAMIWTAPEPSETLVMAASLATITKSALTVGTLLAVLGLMAWVFVMRLRSPPRHES